jgi:hypothetical protein
MNVKQEGADNGPSVTLRQEDVPISAFAALLPATPTEAQKKQTVPSEVQTSVTHYNDHGEPLCTSEKVKHLVEVACPDRWLLPLIERAGGTNGIVKLCYGCGYETIVYVGKAKARDAPTGRLAVGITVNRPNATIKEIGDVCVAGSEILWNCMPRSADPPCIYLRTSDQRFMIPPLPANELQKRTRMLRVWPASDDPKVLERMEDIIDPRSTAAASRPTGENEIGGTDDEPKKKKKAKKDPNMPKHGKNAYNFFLEENIERARAGNPEAKYPEIRERLTEEYKKLSEEEKAKYITMAEEDKEKQEKAIADYLALHPPKGDDDDDDGDADGKPKKKSQRQKKDPKAPKNRMNAFLYWSKDQRPALKEANPDATYEEFNKILSSAYKALSKEELAPYQALAAADKERYDAEMKAYKQSKNKDNGNEKPAAVAEPEQGEEENASVEAASVSKSKKRKSSETDDATEENETEAAPANKSTSKKKKKKKKKHRKSE